MRQLFPRLTLVPSQMGVTPYLPADLTGWPPGIHSSGQELSDGGRREGARKPHWIGWWRSSSGLDFLRLAKNAKLCVSRVINWMQLPDGKRHPSHWQAGVGDSQRRWRVLFKNEGFLFAHSCWVEFSQTHSTVIIWTLPRLTPAWPSGEIMDVEVPGEWKNPIHI